MGNHFDARDVPPQTHVSVLLTGATNASFTGRVNRSGGGAQPFTEAELRAGNVKFSTTLGTSYWILIAAKWRKAGSGTLVTSFTNDQGNATKPPVTMKLNEPADGECKCAVVVF